jgi:hypothetical protein
MLVKKAHGSFARQGSGGGIKGRTMIAIETMLGSINVRLDFWVRFFESFNAFKRYPVILIAEMSQHRAFRLPTDFLLAGHATAVIGHGSTQTIEQASRAPGQQTTPAIAQHGDFA